MYTINKGKVIRETTVSELFLTDNQQSLSCCLLTGKRKLHKLMTDLSASEKSRLSSTTSIFFLSSSVFTTQCL